VWEQLPEPQQFLAALKHKAGLPTNREVAGLMAARYHVQKWKETEAEAS
jgi:AMMECR1 domain-containing protein